MHIIYQPIDSWPKPLTQQRQSSNFRVGLKQTMNELEYELDRLGVDGTVRLCLELRRGQIIKNGSRPYANAEPRHPGVMVVADVPDVGTVRWATDKYDRWGDNLRAIRLALEALRAVDRYGITERREQYRGFAALPVGGETDGRDPAQVLAEVAGLDVELVRGDPRGAWKTARKFAHPDRGGSRELWDQAHDAARQLGVAH